MSTLGYSLGARANELLGDGAWHPREAVILSLGQVIPPGVALRSADRTRVLKHQHDHPGAPPPERSRNKDPESRIRFGRRSIVQTFLGNSDLFEKRKRTVGGTVRVEVRMIRPHRAARSDPIYRRVSDLEVANRRLRDDVAIYAAQLAALRAVLPTLDDYAKSLDAFRETVGDMAARLAEQLDTARKQFAEAADAEPEFADDDEDGGEVGDENG